MSSHRVPLMSSHLASLTSSHLATMVPSFLAFQMPSIPLASLVPFQSLHYPGLIHLFLFPLISPPRRFPLHRHSILLASVGLSSRTLTPISSIRSVISQFTEPGSVMKVSSMFGCAGPITSLLMPTLQLCWMQFRKSWPTIGSTHCHSFRNDTSAHLLVSSPNVLMAFKWDRDLSSIYPVRTAIQSMTAFQSIMVLYLMSHCELQFTW